MPKYGRADFYQEGDFNAACSMCGRKRKAGKLVRNWQGQWRCPEHNEPRQPQDFVRGVQDIQTPPWVQEQRDIDVQICTLLTSCGVAGLGVAGCMTPGRPAPPWEGDLPFYPLTDPITGEAILTSQGQPIMVELKYAGQIVIP